MLNLTRLNWQALYRSRPATWNYAMLNQATLDELQALSQLLGIAYSGTKEQRITRLLQSASVRVELSTWPDTAGDHELTQALINELTKRYTGKRLKELAQMAGTIHYGNKRMMINGLLRWRAQTRQNGQQWNKQYKATIKAQSHTQSVMEVLS